MSNKKLSALIDKILPSCAGDPTTIVKGMARELNADDRRIAMLDPIAKIPMA